MGSGAAELDAQAVRDRSEKLDRLGDVAHAFTDRVPGSGCDLDGVEQHLALNVGVKFAVDLSFGCVQNGVGSLAQIVGILVNELEFPFNADGGSFGRGEREVHVLGLSVDETRGRVVAGAAGFG